MQVKASKCTKYVGLKSCLLVEVCDDPGDKYPFGFTKHEKLNEISGIGNTLDMGDRWLDARIGRTPTLDEKAVLYPGFSPYGYALNTPIQAVDPDGKLVIFVNGFRTSAFIDYIKRQYTTVPIANEPPPWELRGGSYSNRDRYGTDGGSYWRNVDNMFMGQIGDNNSIYTDGGYEPTSSGLERYNRGYQDGIAIVKAIKNRDIQIERDADGKIAETIKLVGHSHGGWHAAGMADAIQAYGKEIGLEVTDLYMINPHQPNDENAQIMGTYRSVQYSRPSDLLSSGAIYNKKGFNANNIAKFHLRAILTNFGNSKLERMNGVKEYHNMRNIDNNKRLDGHFVEDAMELGNLPTGERARIINRGKGK